MGTKARLPYVEVIREVSKQLLLKVSLLMYLKGYS